MLTDVYKKFMKIIKLFAIVVFFVGSAQAMNLHEIQVNARLEGLSIIVRDFQRETDETQRQEFINRVVNYWQTHFANGSPMADSQNRAQEIINPSHVLVGAIQQSQNEQPPEVNEQQPPEVNEQQQVEERQNENDEQQQLQGASEESRQVGNQEESGDQQIIGQIVINWNQIVQNNQWHRLPTLWQQLNNLNATQEVKNTVLQRMTDNNSLDTLDRMRSAGNEQANYLVVAFRNYLEANEQQVEEEQNGNDEQQLQGASEESGQVEAQEELVGQQIIDQIVTNWNQAVQNDQVDQLPGLWFQFENSHATQGVKNIALQQMVGNDDLLTTLEAMQNNRNEQASYLVDAFKNFLWEQYRIALQLAIRGENILEVINLCTNRRQRLHSGDNDNDILALVLTDNNLVQLLPNMQDNQDAQVLLQQLQQFQQQPQQQQSNPPIQNQNQDNTLVGNFEQILRNLATQQYTNVQPLIDFYEVQISSRSQDFQLGCLQRIAFNQQIVHALQQQQQLNTQSNVRNDQLTFLMNALSQAHQQQPFIDLNFDNIQEFDLPRIFPNSPFFNQINRSDDRRRSQQQRQPSTEPLPSPPCDPPSQGVTPTQQPGTPVVPPIVPILQPSNPSVPNNPSSNPSRQLSQGSLVPLAIGCAIVATVVSFIWWNLTKDSKKKNKVKNTLKS